MTNKCNEISSKYTSILLDSNVMNKAQLFLLTLVYLQYEIQL